MDEPAKLSVVAEFPVGYFLENLAVRQDGSILVTAMNKKELWLAQPARKGLAAPLLLHHFGAQTPGEWTCTSRKDLTKNGHG